MNTPASRLVIVEIMQAICVPNNSCVLSRAVWTCQGPRMCDGWTSSTVSHRQSLNSFAVFHWCFPVGLCNLRSPRLTPIRFQVCTSEANTAQGNRLRVITSKCPSSLGILSRSLSQACGRPYQLLRSARVPDETALILHSLHFLAINRSHKWWLYSVDPYILPVQENSSLIQYSVYLQAYTLLCRHHTYGWHVFCRLVTALSSLFD